MTARWRIFWWVIFAAAALYFFLPLFGTFMFSIRARPPISGYTGFLENPRVYTSLAYSFVVGILTIIISVLILVPTAFWVRLRLPQARPFVEFVTLLPFVVPPIVLVFGLISTYSGPPLPLTATDLGSSALLVAAYVILSFPYMYRAIDTGLRTIDIRSLTEASQSLGAGWIRILWQIILPNIRVAILSGAFLTLAIVVGEFTIANMLARPAFAPYLSILGDEVDPYQQAAGALVAFGLTWVAMGFISLLGRGGRSKIQIGGAR
jgi:putative spermidine/putrescine transport system permease protein